MSIVDRIEDVIKAKGLTFKRLERECGLGNGTIKRWETQSPRLEGLMKVSEYLQVSLDYLAFGSSETETFNSTSSNKPLKESEASLIAMYRFLDDRDREDILDNVYSKYKRASGKEASLYSTYTDENSEELFPPSLNQQGKIG